MPSSGMFLYCSTFFKIWEQFSMLLDLIFKDPGQDIADLSLNDALPPTKKQGKRWGAMLLDLIFQTPGAEHPASFETASVEAASNEAAAFEAPSFEP
jgi:hypothetical protein